MMIPVKGTYGNVYSRNGQNYTNYNGWAFDTDPGVLAVVVFSNPYPLDMLQSKPADVWLADGALIHFTCDEDYTATLYRYNRASNAADVSSEQRSVAYCDFPVCRLKIDVVAAGTQATVDAQADTYTGPLRYSRDGGTSWQSSAVFADLVPGQEYTFSCEDTGVSALISCVVTQTLTMPSATPDPPDEPGGGGTLPPDSGPGSEVVEPAAPTEPTALLAVLSPAWMQLSGFGAGQRVHLELKAESGGHRSQSYRTIFTGAKVADAAGRINFRVDGPLAALLRRELPNLLAGSYYDTAAVCNCYAVARLINPTTGALYGPVATALYTAVLALTTGAGRWLTAHPLLKRIERTDPEVLYYLTTPSLPAQVYAVRTVRTRAGVLVEDKELIAVADPNTTASTRYRLLVVPLARVALPQDAATLSVQLQTAEGAGLTQIRTYEFYERSQGTNRVFMWANSQGGVDTLVTTGEGLHTLSVKAEQAERGASPDDGRTTAQRWAFSLDDTRQFRVATGWKTLTERVWLQGLLYSRSVWWLRRSQWVPVVLTKRELRLENDSYDLEGLTLEYVLGSDVANLYELS